MIGLGAAFLTLTAGMYLHHYRERGTMPGMFTNTASVIVIIVNVGFFVLAIRWYTIIYLVDLEMELERTRSKSVRNAYLAFCLQYLLPDWREESHIDDINDDMNHKRRIAQLMSVDRLMRLKDFAKRWAERTRVSMEQKKVSSIEQQAERSRQDLQKRLTEKLSRSRTKLVARIKSQAELRGKQNTSIGKEDASD